MDDPAWGAFDAARIERTDRNEVVLTLILRSRDHPVSSNQIWPRFLSPANIFCAFFGAHEARARVIQAYAMYSSLSNCMHRRFSSNSEENHWKKR